MKYRIFQIKIIFLKAKKKTSYYKSETKNYNNFWKIKKKPKNNYNKKINILTKIIIIKKIQKIFWVKKIQ